MNIVLIAIGIAFFVLFIYELSNAIKSIFAKNWAVVDGKLHKWNLSAEDQGDDIARVIESFFTNINGTGKNMNPIVLDMAFP